MGGKADRLYLRIFNSSPIEQVGRHHAIPDLGGHTLINSMY